MGIVIAGATMSLDGFIAGVDHAMDWVFDYSTGPVHGNALDLGIIANLGAVLVGRGCYDVGAKAERPETSGLYGGLWVGPEFVLTHRPVVGPVSEHTTFLNCPIDEALTATKQAAGEKNVLVLGANVVNQCIDAGLLDEIRLHVVPVILGQGVSFFDRQRIAPVTLQTVSVTTVGQVTDLCYRVRKP
jgi:dihydrofolate reductase